ncbi:MAG TPA: ABC transporter substrate-binding protein [Thermomonas sp.]
MREIAPRTTSRLLHAGALLVACVLAAACTPAYRPPLRVGTNLWLGYEPLYLAAGLGYYDGTPVRLVELGSDTQAMDALRAGRLDAAGLTLDEALTLLEERVPVAIVWVLDVSAGADAVVAKPDIPSLPDLRGKRIGVEQTAVGAYMLDAALRRADLTPADVTLLHLPLDAHVASFNAGSVDAVVTFDPARQALVKSGGRVLFDSRSLPGQIVDVLVVRREALACCSADVGRLIQGQQRALAYLAQHRTDAMERMAPRLALAPNDIAAALDGIVLPDAAYNRSLLGGPTPDLAETAAHQSRLMRQRGLLGSRIDTQALIDGRFLDLGQQP